MFKLVICLAGVIFPVRLRFSIFFFPTSPENENWLVIVRLLKLPKCLCMHTRFVLGNRRNVYILVRSCLPYRQKNSSSFTDVSWLSKLAAKRRCFLQLNSDWQTLLPSSVQNLRIRRWMAVRAPQVFLGLSCYYSYAKWPISSVFPSQGSNDKQENLLKVLLRKPLKKPLKRTLPFFWQHHFLSISVELFLVLAWMHSAGVEHPFSNLVTDVPPVGAVF